MAHPLCQLQRQTVHDPRAIGARCVHLYACDICRRGMEVESYGETHYQTACLSKKERTCPRCGCRHVDRYAHCSGCRRREAPTTSPRDVQASLGASRKWDERFLRLAREVAGWSKDPSTQVGCVIVRPDRTIASLGYNGFPRGLDDSADLYADRDTKYERIIHAEMNALLSATEDLKGYTLYVDPLIPCPRCAVHLIQKGISRVVSVALNQDEDRHVRWAEQAKVAEKLFAEAKIPLVLYDNWS